MYIIILSPSCQYLFYHSYEWYYPFSQFPKINLETGKWCPSPKCDYSQIWRRACFLLILQTAPCGPISKRMLRVGVSPLRQSVLPVTGVHIQSVEGHSFNLEAKLPSRGAIFLQTGGNGTGKIRQPE
jgi:hypothetical protein